MDELRKPLFVVAVVLIVLALLGEVGTLAAHGFKASPSPVRGMGVPYLALVDGLLAYTVGLMGVSLLVPERIHGRIQGIATFVVSLLAVLGGLALILAAVTGLVIMVSLLTALPFGPAIYAGLFAGFETEAASAALATSTTLKLGAAGCLLFAHQRFLQNKGLVLLAATSLLLNVIVGFLHAFPPGLLASVSDAVAGIVVGIAAVVWALVLLIGSIPSVVKAIA